MAGQRDEYNPVAEEIPFDNDTNGFASDDVQAAIEEISTTGGTAAAPGFSFGRSGAVTSNTWLSNEGVPSNKAGHKVRLTTPVIKEINVSSQDIDTYDIAIYDHDGDEINLNLLTTVSIVATRGDEFGVTVVTTNGKQLAAKLTTGTAKNVIVDIVVKGTV